MFDLLTQKRSFVVASEETETEINGFSGQWDQKKSLVPTQTLLLDEFASDQLEEGGDGVR